DPRISAAHFYLGLALKRPPTVEQAMEHFERAIELNPSFPAAHVHIGDSLTLLGRPAEGIEHIKYALRLSPRDPTLGVFLDMAGDAEVELGHLDRALDYYRRASALLPVYPRPRAGLAAAQALAGRIDEAQRAADELKHLVPNTGSDTLISRFGRNENSRYR